MSEREQRIEGMQMDLVMSHLCTGGNFPLWLRFKKHSSPEYISELEEAALDEDTLEFIRSLHGVKL